MQRQMALMTMTTRSKRRQPATASGPVTVHVVEPHLVFHDGEQRAGTLHNVDADTADYWQRHGWVEIIAEQPKAQPKPKPSAEPKPEAKADH
jgi:hypothetical protein